MINLYWVGVRESEILGCENLYKGSITIFGSNKKGNIAYKAEARINHNDEKHDLPVVNYFTKKIRDILKYDKDAKFVHYNQEKAHLYPEDLKEHFININSKNTIDLLNNKFYTKLWLEDIVPTVKNKFFSGAECEYENLKQNFMDENEFVIQSESGAGGFSTFIINEKNDMEVKTRVHKDSMYMVSKYYRNNIPVNIHCVISKDKILLLPASIQVINNSSGKLIYEGADFIEYKNIDKFYKDKLKEYSVKICEKLQKIGYIGVLGIDYILAENEVYFMEINPRFQNSTNVINTELAKRGKMTINKLNILAFENKLPDIDLCEEEIKYSKYAYEYKEKEDIQLHLDEELEILYDGFDTNEKIEAGAYLYSILYRKNICQINKNLEVKFIGG